ncbi:hypothetical protein CJ745_21430 [Salmonella enterica subsp. enterica]|uniref:Uncharacterized protein n=1 Tax=Salmonella enterica subsp. houtenae serovar 45:g,z51:- TaxID=1967611 RepID=A0A736RCW3_SALHO|nr:hypothetical protein [Salmonella enterica]EAW1477792.1 hypothetical protein [Salmonella enterica subsp. enterica]ECG1392069.1 hypothetical protein [Salmonella enterica subsp. houtenae str. CFSAN000557]EED9463113.1 hypothetical protein [Salmonella enterica subsp. enterica serovar Abaetetuba]HAE7767545.1 hypothetical protein [Salmonella enterica subsp. houtenae serovar 45:g,z51:-]
MRGKIQIKPLFIFRWLIRIMQVICIAVVLLGTFDIVLYNSGEPESGDTGTLTHQAIRPDTP